MRRIQMKTTKIKLSIAVIICLMLSIFSTTYIFAQGDDKQEEQPVITKIIEKETEQDIQIRYPNKLTAKEPPQDTGTGNSQGVNTNKGVPSTPSKATATLTENVDNKNAPYPVYHGSNGENSEKYSADARQFITFKTKNGKTFHLIINHNEDSENVMLLTEVSEDDLLNMVETKEKPKEVVKEEPVKEELKEEAKLDENKDKSSTGTYILLALVTLGALGAGYYFKVVKKKEEKEIENLEEDDEDFFAESERDEENIGDDTKNQETKNEESEDETEIEENDEELY